VKLATATRGLLSELHGTIRKGKLKRTESFVYQNS
jgi:hypothetical protein